MEQRFWSKVNKTDTCWLWTGALNLGGYGQFRINGKQPVAHRVSWLLSGNTIPEGFILCHAPHEICGNRHCVNPAHLRVGTHADNEHDKIADATIARGIKINTNKLTEEQVRAIRANPENKTKTELAREYEVSRTLIYYIISRKSWAWLV
jgi:uncharacterized NAD-dependent epimerase/dehydratase family protein